MLVLGVGRLLPRVNSLFSKLLIELLLRLSKFFDTIRALLSIGRSGWSAVKLVDDAPLVGVRLPFKTEQLSRIQFKTHSDPSPITH